MGNNENTFQIYTITNSIDGKKYIGCSYFAKDRYQDHLYNYRAGVDRPLYNDMRYYGTDKFKFNIIDSADSIEKALKLETTYIKFFSPNVYNLQKTSINTNMRSIIPNIESQVLRLYKDGYSQKDLATLFEVAKSTVNKILQKNGIVQYPKKHCKKMNKIEKEYVHYLINLGYSTKDISEIVNRSQCQISKMKRNLALTTH